MAKTNRMMIWMMMMLMTTMMMMIWMTIWMMMIEFVYDDLIINCTFNIMKLLLKIDWIMEIKILNHHESNLKQQNI